MTPVSVLPFVQVSQCTEVSGPGEWHLGVCSGLAPLMGTPVLTFGDNP